jgi:hypothetical protein
LEGKAIHEILLAYGAIETQSDRVAESDSEILLFSAVAGDEDPLRGWEGWSQGGRIYNFPLAGREILDLVLNHEHEGRSLRLFEPTAEALGKSTTFVSAGTFQPDPQQRFTVFDSESTSPLHIVRLQPSGSASKTPVHHAAAAQPSEMQERADLVPLEQHLVSFYGVTTVEARTATKAEQELVEHFATFLRSRQHELHRFKITTHGSICPLFSDLYDATDHILYEAKSSVTRSSLRLALGQILDYRRFLDAGLRTSVLLPSEPQKDMMELLASYDVSTVWKGMNDDFVVFTQDEYRRM